MRLLLFMAMFSLICRNYKRLLLYFKDNNINTSGNYLLLIAHPDDESMFFAPTLLNLNGNIKIICLSKGDTLLEFDTVREKEMISLCEKYNFELQMYSFLDNEDWDTDIITEILLINYLEAPFKTLITFDECGVSGHKNHISCYKSAKIFSKKLNLKTMYLKSLNTFQKYVCNYRWGDIDYIFGFRRYLTAIKMMSYHKSQLLWFRYLYLAFSSYTSYNTY